MTRGEVAVYLMKNKNADSDIVFYAYKPSYTQAEKKPKKQPYCLMYTSDELDLSITLYDDSRKMPLSITLFAKKSSIQYTTLKRMILQATSDIEQMVIDWKPE